MPLDPEVKARLTARFNSKLPGMLVVVEQAHDAMAEGDPEGWEKARHHAHQIAGTAASFGWPEMTTKAQRVLVASADSGLAPLAELVEELRRSIEQCRADSPGKAEG